MKKFYIGINCKINFFLIYKRCNLYIDEEPLLDVLVDKTYLKSSHKSLLMS